MPISAFTNRIAALSRRSAMAPKQRIELPRTTFLAFVAAALRELRPRSLRIGSKSSSSSSMHCRTLKEREWLLS
jgi:hypothetical protein